MARDETASKLQNHAESARDLVAALNSDDADLTHDMVEGETGLFEAIDAALDEIDHCEVLIEGCKAKEEQVKARRQRMESRRDRVRSLIEQAMLVASVDTVKRATATLSVKRVPPKPLYSDEAQIPARFWKQPDPVLDRTAINEAVKAGEQIDGVTLSNGSTSLTIRRA